MDVATPTSRHSYRAKRGPQCRAGASRRSPPARTPATADPTVPPFNAAVDVHHGATTTDDSRPQPRSQPGSPQRPGRYGARVGGARAARGGGRHISGGSWTLSASEAREIGASRGQATLRCERPRGVSRRHSQSASASAEGHRSRPRRSSAPMSIKPLRATGRYPSAVRLSQCTARVARSTMRTSSTSCAA
jgi:hypothetical protein